MESTSSTSSIPTYGSITPVDENPPPSFNLGKPSLPPKSITVWDLLGNPKIQTMLLSGFLLSFISVAYDVVFILFSYSPIELGGLAKSVRYLIYYTPYQLAYPDTLSPLKLVLLYRVSELWALFSHSSCSLLCMTDTAPSHSTSSS